MLGQRRYERVAFFCPVQVTVLPDGPTVPANTIDISLGGVGVMTAVMLERGQDVCLRFQLQNGMHQKIEEEILGRVAYCRADEDGDRIGIEFLQVIQDSRQPVLSRRFNNL